MSIFLTKSGFAWVLVALCLGGRAAHAQAAPVAYWIPGWPFGFAGNPAASQSSNTYGNFPSFDGSDARHARYDFPSGWFVGGEGGGMGSTVNGFNQGGAFGNLYYEGVQFGYNFQNAPLRIFGGLDTLKYNSGIGSPFAPFSSTSTTLPGYSAHAGVEFKATPNVSLSLGFGYTQTSGRIDSDTSSPALSNESPYALVGGRH